MSTVQSKLKTFEARIIDGCSAPAPKEIDEITFELQQWTHYVHSDEFDKPDAHARWLESAIRDLATSDDQESERTSFLQYNYAKKWIAELTERLKNGPISAELARLTGAAVTRAERLRDTLARYGLSLVTPYVLHWVAPWQKTYPGILEDCQEAADAGMVKAIESYNADDKANARFKTFASRYVENEMKHVRDHRRRELENQRKYLGRPIYRDAPGVRDVAHTTDEEHLENLVHHGRAAFTDSDVQQNDSEIQALVGNLGPTRMPILDLLPLGLVCEPVVSSSTQKHRQLRPTYNIDKELVQSLVRYVSFWVAHSENNRSRSISPPVEPTAETVPAEWRYCWVRYKAWADLAIGSSTLHPDTV